MATDEKLFARRFEKLFSPYNPMISRATNEKYSLALFFLSLSLSSIDLFIADVMLAIFCRLVPIKLSIFMDLYNYFQ